MANFQDVQAFLSNFSGAGARANRFKVEVLYVPPGVTLEAPRFSFLCRAASIPASAVTPVEVPYLGALLKVAGERTFDDWTISVYNDTDWGIRWNFERWVELIMGGQSNVASYPGNVIFGNLRVTQLDRAGNVIPQGVYSIFNVFPASVGPIELSYDANNAVEMFDVTLSVGWWTSSASVI